LHFKPRTDLERIIETINKHTLGKVDNKVLNKQQQLIMNNSNDVSEDNYYYDTVSDIHTYNPYPPPSKKKKLNSIEQKPTISSIPTISNNTLNIVDTDSINIGSHVGSLAGSTLSRTKKNIKKKLNKDAKSIMGEYHIKTHFKGISQLALKKIQLREPVDEYSCFNTEGSKHNNNNNTMHKRSNTIGNVSDYLTMDSQINRQLTLDSEQDNFLNIIDVPRKKLNSMNPHKIRPIAATNEVLESLRDMAFNDQDSEETQIRRYNDKKQVRFSTASIDTITDQNKTTNRTKSIGGYIGKNIY